MPAKPKDLALFERLFDLELHRCCCLPPASRSPSVEVSEQAMGRLGVLLMRWKHSHKAIRDYLGLLKPAPF